MTSFWCDVATQYVAFDELVDCHPAIPSAFTQTDVSPVHCPEGVAFRANILRLISLLHATAMSYLMKMGSFEVMGGVSHEEEQQLAGVADQPYFVLHLINQTASRRYKAGGLPIPPPILARPWQSLSAGMQEFNQACKLDDTPFPFPYAQLMWLLDVSLILVIPIVMMCWTEALWWSLALSVLVVGCMHAIFIAACHMERPFGKRPNDLPFLELHTDFLNRLKCLVDPFVAAELNQMVRRVMMGNGDISSGSCEDGDDTSHTANHVDSASPNITTVDPVRDVSQDKCSSIPEVHVISTPGRDDSASGESVVISAHHSLIQPPQRLRRVSHVSGDGSRQVRVQLNSPQAARLLHRGSGTRETELGRILRMGVPKQTSKSTISPSLLPSPAQDARMTPPYSQLSAPAATPRGRVAKQFLDVPSVQQVNMLPRQHSISFQNSASVPQRTHQRQHQRFT